MGLTTKGSIGARTARTLDDCVREVAAIAEAGEVRPRPTCWSSATAGRSPIPADAQYILDRVPSVDGFYGASSMERLPTEIAIARQVRDFVGLKIPGGR